MTITPTSWPLAEEISLAADTRAPRIARRLLALSMRRWGLPADAHYADTLLSELVTNAVKAAESPDSEIKVYLYCECERAALKMSVWDSSPGEPVVLQPDELPEELPENGRGLFLVARLSEEWGWFRCPEIIGGKVVWCLVGCKPA